MDGLLAGEDGDYPHSTKAGHLPLTPVALMAYGECPRHSYNHAFPESEEAAP